MFIFLLVELPIIPMVGVCITVECPNVGPRGSVLININKLS